MVSHWKTLKREDFNRVESRCQKSVARPLNTNAGVCNPHNGCWSCDLWGFLHPIRQVVSSVSFGKFVMQPLPVQRPGDRIRSISKVAVLRAGRQIERSRQFRWLSPAVYASGSPSRICAASCQSHQHVTVPHNHYRQPLHSVSV